MADRCFPNTMRDYEISLDDSHADKTCEAPEHSLLDPGKLLKVAISLKDEVGFSHLFFLAALSCFYLSG